MKRIYSKVNQSLLHFNFLTSELLADGELNRADLIDPENFLQLSILKLNQTDTFAPHVHIERDNKMRCVKAQESWVIMQGSVRVDYFDLDDTYLDSDILSEGSVSVTLHGGHSYTAISKEARVLEFKSGPYEGKHVDKRMIEPKND
jgi:hypothetical protein